MSKEELDKLAKKIKPVIVRMSLELYKNKTNEMVNENIFMHTNKWNS